MNVPCRTRDWVTAYGSVSNNTCPAPSYAIVRSIYVLQVVARRVVAFPF